MADTIRQFYSAPSQNGGNLPVFMGSRRQVGGSFLSGLARFALPILKNIGGRLFNVAKNVASDVIIDKKPIRGALKQRGIEEVRNVMTGKGIKRKRSINKPAKRKKCIDTLS